MEKVLTPKQKASQREFIIISVLLMVVNLVIAFFSEKMPKTLLSSFDAYRDARIIDGINSDSYLLIFNVISVVSSIVIIIFLMCRNRTKLKSRCGVIFIVLLLLLMPVKITYKSGGIAGISETIYTSTLQIPYIVSSD